jgi:hypothetical protein
VTEIPIHKCAICGFKTVIDREIVFHIRDEHPTEYALHKWGYYKKTGGYLNRK